MVLEIFLLKAGIVKVEEWTRLAGYTSNQKPLFSWLLMVLWLSSWTFDPHPLMDFRQQQIDLLQLFRRKIISLDVLMVALILVSLWGTCYVWSSQKLKQICSYLFPSNRCICCKDGTQNKDKCWRVKPPTTLIVMICIPKVGWVPERRP